jgi:hypothetical protein
MTATAGPVPARHLKCPGCKAGLRFKGDPAGKRVKCPKCSHQWVVVDVPPDLSASQKALGSEAAARGQSGPVQPVPGSTEQVDPWVGKTLGQFQIIRLLGKGGMGSVYEAMDTVLQRFAALKVLPPQVSGDPKTLERFLREARAACQISHPNLVGVYQVGQDQGVTFIVMQLVRGGNCTEWVKQRGAMTAAQASWIIGEAARGLNAAHAQGIIHRDIKPSNLMLDEGGSVKVADFGLAKSADVMDVGLTTPGEVVGTPSYMSPEQCRGDPLGPQSDLYSLGATYFFLLTGRPPFQAENPTGIMFKHVYEPIPDPRADRPELPEGCWQVILRSMAKEPSMRYQTGEEMAADLAQVEAAGPAEAYAGGGGVEVFEPPAGDPAAAVGLGGLSATRPSLTRAYRGNNESGTIATLMRTNPTAFYGAVGAAAALVLVLILFFVLRGGDRRPSPPPDPNPPGPGPLVTGPGPTDGGTGPVGPADGGGTGETKKGGTQPVESAGGRLERLRRRLDSLRERGSRAEGKELAAVIAELEQFKKDRLQYATTSEELELGKAAGAEIDRLTFGKLDPLPPLKFEPGPAFGEIAPGTTLTLFDGKLTEHVRAPTVGSGWAAGAEQVAFDTRNGPRGGNLWLNLPDIADFEMSLKVRWESTVDAQNDFAIRYRLRPGQLGGGFGVCFAPSHAMISRLTTPRDRLERIRDLPRPGTWYDLVVQVKGRTHRVLVDGREAAQMEHDETGAGRIYMFAMAGTVAVKDWKITVGGGRE